jgi:hypothetical protein
MKARLWCEFQPAGAGSQGSFPEVGGLTQTPKQPKVLNRSPDGVLFPLQQQNSATSLCLHRGNGNTHDTTANDNHIKDTPVLNQLTHRNEFKIPATDGFPGATVSN